MKHQAPGTRHHEYVPIIIFVVCWTLTTHGKYSASGDEPHYLMVCQSLLADADLDLRNNYANDDGRLFGAAGLEMGQHVRENRSGRLFPVHDVGMPIVLTPVYAAARLLARIPPEPMLSRFRMTRGLFAYSIVSLAIIALVTMAAVLTRLALVSLGAAPTLASAMVIALWLSPPVLSNSFLVFPEAFALLATAIALRLASGRADRPFRTDLLLLAASLGCLPWFHRKYAVYGLALLFAAVWWRKTEALTLSRSEQLKAAAVYIAPQLALAAWTWWSWGNLGGPLMLDGAPFAWDAFKAGAQGLLIDRENGLFVWAPIYLLLPAAWVLAGRRHAAWLLPATALFLLSAAHSQWWGGFSPAARFLVPLIPIFASVGASAWNHRMFRGACLALLVPQIVIAAYGWQHTRGLWPQGDGHNRVLDELLGWVGASERWLPSLRTSASVQQVLVWMGAIAAINAAILMMAARRSGRPAQSAPDR